MGVDREEGFGRNVEFPWKLEWHNGGVGEDVDFDEY